MERSKQLAGGLVLLSLKLLNLVIISRIVFDKLIKSQHD